MTIVGAGEIAEFGYLPAVRRLGWQAVIADRVPERARDLARRHGRIVSAVPSVDALPIEASDLVVIATPPATHYELALNVLAAGANRVLVEKPPFTSLEELAAVVQTAAATGATVRSSFVHRAWPGVKAAKTNFQSWREEFGRLRSIAVIEGRPWAWPSATTLERGASGLEPIIYDDIPHPLDAAFYVTGLAVESVQGSPDTDTVATPWEFYGEANVSGRDGSMVSFLLRGSRTAVLANAITLSFETGKATVETTTVGGVIVHPAAGRPVLLATRASAARASEMFAQLLHEAANDVPCSEVAPNTDEWRHPQSVLSCMLGRRPAEPPGRAAK